MLKTRVSARWECARYALDGIFHQRYIPAMPWDVEYTDEFGAWWASLSEDEQESVAASVGLLEARGPALGFPHSSGINGSKHGHMRALVRSPRADRRPAV